MRNILSLLLVLVFVGPTSFAHEPGSHKDHSNNEHHEDHDCDCRAFVSFHLGGAHNFQTPLNISIDGQDDINIDKAEYAVNPFKSSPYYVLRIGSMHSNYDGIEFELLHHKLYLETEHPDIQGFEITDGYNGFSINRLIPWKGVVLRLGGSLVITHPETVIYNQKYPWNRGLFGTGYHLSGLGVRAGVSKFIELNDKWFIEAEASTWMTYSKISVADGSATIPHASIHGNVGLGYFF